MSEENKKFHETIDRRIKEVADENGQLSFDDFKRLAKEILGGIPDNIDTEFPDDQNDGEETEETYQECESTQLKGKCGQIVNSDGVWKFNTGNEPVSESYTTIYVVNHEDIAAIPYTDHFTPDTIIICHDGKYGIYTLSGLGDYGDDGTLEWIGQSEEAFPYDEVCVLGFNMRYFGFIAYRIGLKWGVDSAIYDIREDRVYFETLVPCEYSSLAEVEKEMPQWRSPYDEQ